MLSCCFKSLQVTDNSRFAEVQASDMILLHPSACALVAERNAVISSLLCLGQLV